MGAAQRVLGAALKRDVVTKDLDVLTLTPRLFIGWPGTGKSSLAAQLGKALGLPVYPLHCSRFMTESSVYGGNTADPWGEQPLRWLPGPALVAMGHGLVNPRTGEKPPSGILLIDDLHLAVDSDGMDALYALLCQGPGGNLFLPWGEVIQAPGPSEYRCMITANGTVDQFPEQIRSRLGGSIVVNEPSRAMYGALNALDAVVAKTCYVDYHNLAGPSLTYRHWLNLAELMPRVGLKAAIMVVCDGDAELAASKLQVLATQGMTEAGAVLTEIANAERSGAPGE